MHEHGSEKCRKIADGIGKEAAGNESPLHNKGVAAIHLNEEEQDVQDDQYICYDGHNFCGSYYHRNQAYIVSPFEFEWITKATEKVTSVFLNSS
jgi:hypothetical protein